MRLTSIKLSGFKSFVDPTNFQVPGQLVGVVGPNGCGKSNIIDAVRWVLGESKASELRGESMQDVIFNGSTHRKPAGRCSVELVFDNSLGKAAGQWGQFAEIAVRRVLTRDGTSTYHINNQVVRRRDIQDIFLGTGLGPRAYAIIGQGMISRIIEARPEELRIFLEEAAGVSKYKERRRETENRLHDTRENLLRVEDILRELNANLEKLQEQAAVATEYHALQAQHDERQKLLWLLRRNEAKAEQEKAFRAIEQAQIELEQQTAKLRHVETELEHMRQAHYAAGDHLHQAQGHLYQTNAEIGGLEAQIKFVVESRNRLQAQLQTLKVQRESWQSQAQRHREELAEAEFASEELAMRVEQAIEAAQQESDRLPALEQAWRDAQQRSADARASIMQAQQQLELEAAQQRNAGQVLASLAARRERLAQEMQGMAVPDSERLADLQMQMEAEQAALEEAQDAHLALQEQLPLLEQERREAQAQVNAESAQIAQLDASLAALKQLQESVQTKGKVQPWLAKHELADLPRLWQKLQIEPGWETALEAVLRERTSALEISNIEWAKAFFSDAPAAKLAMYSPSFAGAAAQEPAPDLKPLVSLLKFNDAGLRILMQDWLRDVYIAEDAQAAFSDLNKLPAGACFVTRPGHTVSRNCVRFYAADSEQDGMLERQRAIENLSRQHRAQQLLSEEAKARSLRAESALAQANAQAQQLQQRINNLTKTIHGLQIDIVKLSELQARFNQRSTQIVADLAEIKAQEAEHQQTRVESEAKFEQLDVELAQLQESYEAGQTQYQAKEQQLSEARQRLRDSERAAQEAQFAEKSHRNRMDELRRNLATAHEQAAQLAESIEQGAVELESLDDQAAQAGLRGLLDRRSEQERALSSARHELDQLTQKMRHMDEARLQAERSLNPAREGIMELQLKEQAARLNQEQFAQMLAEAQADEGALAEKLNPDLRPSTLQAEVTRLTNAITALGAVNLAALDELAAASERKRFLDEQNADLTEAIATLEDAIQRIDKETRALLQETFDKVNAHFAELFPILFGGGQARLIMTGEEILDSGVQVMAQPPGKKNATIHLLSGGEKALTATALVFSMFQLNPAPFCLLDEVDAPLDDANTERFCKMVQRMSSNTQFLFISHNKIAMEMAQQLIGVTMQEQGVSRIVAVDMEVAANFAQEAQPA